MKRPLILLFGMPRSGTTWIGKIFDSHPQILYRHEPDSWVKLTGFPLYADIQRSTDYNDHLMRYAEHLEDIHLPQVTTKLPLFRKDYSSAFRFGCYRISVLLSNVISRLKPSFVLPTLNVISKPKTEIHIAWKSIESLGRLGVLARCLPDSKSIHIVRHPCGYIASVLKGEQGEQFVSSARSSEDYDLFEQLLKTENGRLHALTKSDLKSMQPVERLAWRWLLVNEKAMQDLHGMSNSMILRYEDLCENPLRKSQELFDFAGLQWNEQTESFVDSSTHNSKDGYYSVFKNPKEAANKWRSYLSEDEQFLIRQVMNRSELLSPLYSDMP